MTPPSWVLDTNVIVSGLLIAEGFPGRLLDAVLAGLLRITCDDRIESEYREVLSRLHFAISPVRREAFLDELKSQDHVTSGPWSGALLSDPDDLPFLETAFHSTGHILVTGNLRHYPPSCRRSVKVLTPRDAWARLTGDISR